ncbi:PepSY domain-containing protein [Streptomyces sp. NPDC087903]|uniref:PepSY domain-containing protein n=1 Tax=Streptomyces sp. NPDC087903 TaxID=3365819 RepID=UPI00381DD24A
MKRNIVIAVVACAALVGGGTATALAVTGDGEASGSGQVRQTDARDADDDGGRDDDDGRADDEAARVASADVTAGDAIASALRHASGTVVSAELDDEEGSGAAVVWEVDVLAGDNTWKSVRIDAANGRVLGSTAEREDDTPQVRAALKGAPVTAAKAAEAVHGKGTVTAVELDEDGTSKAWEVETRGSAGQPEQDWRVDLRTGKVTADRSDD